MVVGGNVVVKSRIFYIRHAREGAGDYIVDIVEADMKYLKSMFNKLEREKQASVQAAMQEVANPAVSLEIQGVDIPVSAQAGQSAAELVEGANVDAMV